MIELSHSQIENYIELLQVKIDTQATLIAKLQADIWKLENPKGSICPMTGYRDDGKPGMGAILKEEYDDTPSPAWVATLTPAEKVTREVVTTDEALQAGAIKARKLANRERAKQAKAKLRRRKK